MTDVFPVWWVTWTTGEIMLNLCILLTFSCLFIFWLTLLHEIFGTWLIPNLKYMINRAYLRWEFFVGARQNNTERLTRDLTKRMVANQK